MAPAYADGYYMRGIISEELGNIDDARSDFIQTLNINASHALAKEAIDRINRN